MLLFSYLCLYAHCYPETCFTILKSDIKRFISFLTDGGLEDFFEFDEEAIIYGDNYLTTPDSMVTDITIANEDGVSVEEFDVEDFLELFCGASKKLEVYGFIYDAEENEYNFRSDAGDDFYENARDVSRFNDELDSIRDEEEEDEE